MTVVGAARLCRMDDALVARIAGGQRLGAVAIGAAATILVGAGAYGFAFGIWRAPEQALYSAIKLPVLLAALVLATTSINAMLAVLLRAPIGLRQSAVCILVGLATTAAILGALAPVSAFVALSVPPPDPAAFGLPLGHPIAEAANRAAQSLLLFHVAAIAIAGVLGNLRLFALLRRLGGRREVAARVLVAWLGVELLAGSELSWIFRPFLGRPHRAPELISGEMFEGSFFEEVVEACAHALGVEGVVAVVVMCLALALTGRMLLRRDGLRVDVELDLDGVHACVDDRRFFVRWSQVAAIRTRRATVLGDDDPELVLDVVGDAPTSRLLVRFDTDGQRDEVAARAEHLRARVRGPGPFRSATLRTGSPPTARSPA